MDLRASATEAEDVAAGFTLFRAPLPEHEAEITDLIADLYTISSSLRRLDGLIQGSRSHSQLAHRRARCRLAPYTVEDIFGALGRLNGRAAPPDKYREAWRTMELFCWEESKTSLRMRLARYRAFLGELGDVMQNKTQDFPLLDAHRENLKMLVATQERQRVTDRFGRMSFGRNANAPSTGSGSGHSTAPSSPVSDRRPRRGSFERTRPAHRSPQSPQSPLSPGFGRFEIPIPPLAPEAPSSPLTGSASATTNTSQSVRSDVIQNHWIKDAFDAFNSKTELSFHDEEIGCFGKPTPGIKEQLAEDGFDRLLRLDFDDGSDITVYYYLRETDNRTRIIIRAREDHGNEYYCLPLNMLEIIRSGSSLQLCRRRNSGKELHAWASLGFDTIESMVEFFCVFLALRSQDTTKALPDIRDYELEGEEEVYGGQILDDSQRRALRVYRDKKTKAVRFQSSVLGGETDKAPVWTAFVTSNIGRRGWLRSIDPRTILVRDLRPLVLLPAEEYTLPQLETGQHVLRFITPQDAETFLDSIEDLAEKKTRGVRYV
ncbi:hypothetical protein N7533_006683 [Penicillium manginii]|uniref:uncharacterized protein n=1 Tax=Penicillium manginii TaxID=203109 RepID=UPI002547875C|nr:uncharacterized protein N7533_006683 [Penicillium manginii]KAJ5749655.1 hypothetical protein N7533_006683 [Penicillium manginii]